MRRREFMTILGGAAVFGPRIARAQGAMPVVGLLSGTNREPRLIDAIWKGLNEIGYTDYQTATMEYRFAEGHFERLPALAAELVRDRAKVIVAIQSVAAPMAAKALTPGVPVVFSIGGDPVKLGLVSSLARPGGNVTGATFLVNTLSAKRLELLRDLLPAVKVMGLLVNPKNPASLPETNDVQAGAQALGLQLHVRHASNEQTLMPRSRVSQRKGSARSPSPQTRSSTHGEPSSSPWQRAMPCRRCIFIASSPTMVA
jgi:putative ABC transport system substrate-binding protein